MESAISIGARFSRMAFSVDMSFNSPNGSLLGNIGMGNVKRLLKPGGKILLVELTTEQLHVYLPFAPCPVRTPHDVNK